MSTDCILFYAWLLFSICIMLMMYSAYRYNNSTEGNDPPADEQEQRVNNNNNQHHGKEE